MSKHLLVSERVFGQTADDDSCSDSHCKRRLFPLWRKEKVHELASYSTPGMEYMYLLHHRSARRLFQCRIVYNVENTLIRSGRFRLPGKKWLLQGHEVPAVVVVDVTETPIERPKHRQKQFYSGKKKRHTLKSQVVVDQQSRTIICTAHGKGRRHDFWLWNVSGVRLHPSTQGLGDKGYQGWKKLHANSQIPKKKLKGEQLPKQDKRSNRS